MEDRTLFVGDVHGCAEELEALLADAQAERVVLLGDLFTKGPDPAGVWALIGQHRAEAVMGNHDVAFLARWPPGSRQAPVPAEALLWLDVLPLAIEQERWLAVHAGLHPTGGLAQTSEWMAMNLRRWPEDAFGVHPFWWEQYSGERLILYGHDARRGLQDHRPRTLGLDTGCVYGGRLTGYLLEEDRLLSVPARREYRAVQGSAADS